MKLSKFAATGATLLDAVPTATSGGRELGLDAPIAQRLFLAMLGFRFERAFCSSCSCHWILRSAQSIDLACRVKGSWPIEVFHKLFNGLRTVLSLAR